MSDMDLICRSHKPFQMKTIKWDMLFFILQFPHTWKSLLSSCKVFEPRLQQCYYRLWPRWTMGNRDLLALDDAVTALCCGYLHRIFYGLGLWDCRQVGTGTESLEVDSWDKSADAYQILIFLSSKMHQQTSLFEFGDLKSWFWPHVLPRPSPMCSDALLMWTFAIARDIGSWASTWSTFCPRCGSQFFQCLQRSLRILLIQLIMVAYLISHRLRCFEFDVSKFRRRPESSGARGSRWTVTRTAPQVCVTASPSPSSSVWSLKFFLLAKGTKPLCQAGSDTHGFKPAVPGGVGSSLLVTRTDQTISNQSKPICCSSHQGIESV